MAKRAKRVTWWLAATAVSSVALVALYQSRLSEPIRSSGLPEPRGAKAVGIMHDRLVKLLEPMSQRPGASEATLQRLRNYVGADLPADYLQFLRWSDGVWGVMRTPRQPIAALGGTGPQGSLHSVAEAIEYTQAWTGRAGYLWLGAFNDGSDHLLLDTRGGDPKSMVYLRVDQYWDEDAPDSSQRYKPYRTTSLYDLLHHLSAHEVFLIADLRGHDLREVDLFHVCFVEAPLAGADLTGADLREAMVTGTDLSGANLTNAQVTGAIYNRRTRWPQGFDPRRHGAVRYEELR
jgi:hypothetical protein